MFCDKCQVLAAGGKAGRGHTDLVHMGVRLYKALKAPLVDARTDEYECKSCATRWEVDYDPSVEPNYSPFRSVT